ncbi:unnamed protein product, partial [Ectocarpus sp. 4 AP-2014]
MYPTGNPGRVDNTLTSGQLPPQAHAARSDGGGRGIPGRAQERPGVSSRRGPRGLQHGRRKGRG